MFYKRRKMKNKRSILLVSGMILLSLLLAACSSADETSFPTGKFIKSGASSHGLIFNPDGTFSVFEGGTTLVTGTYSVDGDTYIEESNNAGCTDVPKRFKYTFDGTNLTFTYVGNPAEDTCGGGGRRADFDNVTYTLSK
jgi:predicted small secreted protein